MQYYRFRPWSEISLKELYYSEIYFSSNEECNDPLDGKTHHVFPNEEKSWKKFIDFCTRKGPYTLDISQVSAITSYYVSKCPATYDEIVVRTKMNASTDLAGIVDEHILNIVINDIEKQLRIYDPSPDYFVSFSKTCSEPLMWSHYSSKHEGFCLIFRLESSVLTQHPQMKKKAFDSYSSKGIAKNMSWMINDSFQIQKLEYNSVLNELNAFYCLPNVAISGIVTEEEMEKYMSELEVQKRTKHFSWSYEKEFRAVLNSPKSWLFGKKFELSKQNRLFHYHPDHLVGIIFGSRMSFENKKRIKEIITERDRNADFGEYNRLMSSFVLFDSRISHNSRDVKLFPNEILNGGSWYSKDDDKFDSLYKEWNDGYVIELEYKTGKSRKRKIAT